MIFPSGSLKVYLALGATDMRQAINGLSIIVSEQYNKDPFSGHLFVFCNKRRTILKILYWEVNGFCLWQKRLEKERFRWPDAEEELNEISHRELLRIIDGLELHQPQGHKRLSYSCIN